MTLFPNNYYYQPVHKDGKLAKERRIQYYNKNKIKYDAWFLPMKFKVGDDITYEEFHYFNPRKLILPYPGPYKI